MSDDYTFNEEGNLVIPDVPSFNFADEVYPDTEETSTPDYIFNENNYLEEIKKYIDATYNQHYSQGKYQATEFIVGNGHGISFGIGNIMKYSQRYGKKGGPDDWRKDLMKTIHYAIIALYAHDNKG